MSETKYSAKTIKNLINGEAINRGAVMGLLVKAFVDKYGSEAIDIARKAVFDWGEIQGKALASKVEEKGIIDFRHAIATAPNEINPFDPEEDESVPAGWVVQNPYPRGQALRGVSVADAMTATVVGSDGIILRTVDGGESWEIQESGVDVFLYDVSFATPDIGTVIGAKIVLRTVDGGATWTKQVSITDPQATSNFSNVCFSHPDTGSISHSGNLMMTTDGGDSWIDRRICYDYIYEVSFCDTRNGMALISRSVLRTYDGGITWAGCQLPSYPFPFSMSMFDPHNAYITAVGYGFPG